MICITISFSSECFPFECVFVYFTYILESDFKNFHSFVWYNSCHVLFLTSNMPIQVPDNFYTFHARAIMPLVLFICHYIVIVLTLDFNIVRDSLQCAIILFFPCIWRELCHILYAVK